MKELTQLDADQLQGKMKELQLELIKLRAQVATGTTPKSPGRITQIKRNIARIHTARSQKERTKA